MQVHPAAHGAAKVALGGLMLLVPALINGYPFLYFDTESYYLLGQSILGQAPWLADDPTPAVATAGAGPPVADTNDSLTYVGGRSPFYALLVRLGSGLGSFWPVALIQALVAAWLIYATIRAWRPDRPDAAFWGVMVTLTLASSLPFYVDFMMPDVFAGLGVLALTLLALAHHRFGRAERMALVATAAFGVAAHGSNLALALAVLVTALGVGLWMRVGARALRNAAGWALGPVILAVGANAGYGLAVKLVLGESPRNPPYILARVLSDGPGRLYLKHACGPDAQFEICQHAGKPLDDPNLFLWSPDPDIGVFQQEDGAGRRRLIAQEMEFVVGAVSAFPAEQAAASATNSLKQLGAFSVSGDLGWAPIIWDQMTFATTTPWAEPGVKGGLAYRDRFPFRLADVTVYGAAIVALAFLVWRNLQPDIRRAVARTPATRSATDRERLLVLGLTLGLLILLVGNAILCGSLSGAFNRYQARVIWLLPLWAMMVAARHGLRGSSLADREA